MLENELRLRDQYHLHLKRAGEGLHRDRRGIAAAPRAHLVALLGLR